MPVRFDFYAAPWRFMQLLTRVCVCVCVCFAIVGHLFLDLVELASYRLGSGGHINQWQMLFAMTEVLMMLSDGQLVSRTLHVLEGVFQKLLADDQAGVVVVGEDLRGVLYEHAQAEFGRSLGLVAMRPDPFQSRTAEHIHDMLDTLGRFDG